MNGRCAGFLAASVLVCGANQVMAQGVENSPLLKLSKADLRTEVDKRYDEALAKTLSPAVARANTSVFTWASEAKVACGIAIGFLKTSTVDEDSVNKCDLAYRLMNAPPPPPAAPLPPPPMPVAEAARPAICSNGKPFVVYFAFDVDVPPPEAKSVVSLIAEGYGPCGWKGLQINGHTDRSGSDDYNQKLSERRAKNVADLFAQGGIPTAGLSVAGKGETQPAVDTPDGTKEPLNRRVEVTPIPAQ